MNIAHYISNWWKEALEYKERVLKDGGITKREDVVQRYYQMCKEQGILNSIKFAWLGEAGGKFRDSGANRFWTKAYSLVTTNDATQTTSTFQPYLSGNIAPTEKFGMKNPNGGGNYMTHPTISFAANEAWSVTTVVNWNGDNTTSGGGGRYAGADATSYIGLVSGGVYNVRIRPVNSSNTIDFLTWDSKKLLGKNSIVTISVKNSVASLYVNGILIEEKSFLDGLSFNRIFSGLDLTRQILGSINAHIIRAQALTPSQVSAEANFLRSLYPEIPSVTIGSQVWATSNCEMVATPQGNLIANITDNTAWTNSTTLYTNAYNGASGTDEQKTYAAVKAAAMWCYYNNDVALGSTYGKLYNWYAVKLLQMDIDYYNAANPSTPWGWRVPTDTDFNTLATTLGGASVAGGKMKKDGLVYWSSPNTGADNSSGFSGIGSGYRDNLGGFFVKIKL